MHLLQCTLCHAMNVGHLNNTPQESNINTKPSEKRNRMNKKGFQEFTPKKKQGKAAQTQKNSKSKEAKEKQNKHTNIVSPNSTHRAKTLEQFKKKQTGKTNPHSGEQVYFGQDSKKHKTRLKSRLKKTD